MCILLKMDLVVYTHEKIGISESTWAVSNPNECVKFFKKVDFPIHRVDDSCESIKDESKTEKTSKLKPCPCAFQARYRLDTYNGHDDGFGINMQICNKYNPGD